MSAFGRRADVANSAGVDEAIVVRGVGWHGIEGMVPGGEEMIQEGRGSLLD